MNSRRILLFPLFLLLISLQAGCFYLTREKAEVRPDTKTEIHLSNGDDTALYVSGR